MEERWVWRNQEERQRSKKRMEVKEENWRKEQNRKGVFFVCFWQKLGEIMPKNKKEEKKNKRREGLEKGMKGMEGPE